MLNYSFCEVRDRDKRPTLKQVLVIRDYKGNMSDVIRFEKELLDRPLVPISPFSFEDFTQSNIE